jgi:hypothetical protein
VGAAVLVGMVMAVLVSAPRVSAVTLVLMAVRANSAESAEAHMEAPPLGQQGSEEALQVDLGLRAAAAMAARVAHASRPEAWRHRALERKLCC